MPSFLDSFLTTGGNSQAGYYDLLWEKLFRFLLNHRLQATSLNEPYLQNRIKVFDLRQRILVELERDFNDRTIKV